MNGNANLNANNLTPQNVADWREKLGIADAPDLTNYAKKDASNLDSANITSWKSKLDIDDLQTQTNENAQNITNIQNSVNNNANNITNLQSQVNVNSQNISNNTNAISSLQTNLNNEVDALSQLIDANTDDISTNANNITNLQNNKVDKVNGKGLSTNDFTNADKTKLDNLSNYDDTALKNRVSQNEINIANNTNSIETLATELLETNENVENNANNITQNATNISSLQSGLSTTNANVLNLTTRVSANENSIETLDSAIDGIKLKNTQQDGRLDAIELVDIPNISSEVNTIKSNYITKNVNDLANYTKTSDLAEVATTGDYNDLANRPTIPAGAVIYQQTGQNINGAMSQKATTDALNTLTGAVVNKANADGTNITNVSIWQTALGITTMQSVCDLIYPIGSIYINRDTVDPNALFPGTQWSTFAGGGKTLYTEGLLELPDGTTVVYEAGQEVKPGIPNITGDLGKNGGTGYNVFIGGSDYRATIKTDGAFSTSMLGDFGGFGSGNGWANWYNVLFDASKGETKINGLISNNVYGKSNTVQTAGIVVRMWVRIA